MRKERLIDPKAITVCVVRGSGSKFILIELTKDDIEFLNEGFSDVARAVGAKVLGGPEDGTNVWVQTKNPLNPPE